MNKVQIKASLLNTKEAARLLRVSEASIRRWSNSGLLEARRVGRRRERRFERSELERFLGQATSKRPDAPTATLAVGGFSIPLKGHFAPIYSTDDSALRLTVPFLADGLRAGETSFLVAEGEILERYSAALATEPGVDLESAMKSGRFVILRWEGASATDVIASWEKLFDRALAARPAVLRVAGDMASELQMFGAEAAMMEYEEAYDRMARRYPLVTLCAYDARRFGGETILRMLKAHPDMFEQNIGLFLS